MTRLEQFARLLAYNPNTGQLTWIGKPSRGVLAGSVAGMVKSEGYIRVKYRGANEYAHRIIWVIMTGMAPPAEIDHANGMRSDNRWANLRAADRQMNAENMRRARSDNGSGVLGAMKNKKGYMARIRARGLYHYLGTYQSAAMAHEVYVQAKRRLHPGGTL